MPAYASASPAVARERSTLFDRSIAIVELAARPPYGDNGPNARLTERSTLTLPAHRLDGPTSDVRLGRIDTETGCPDSCFSSAIFVSTPPSPYFASRSNPPHTPRSARSLSPNRATMRGNDSERPRYRSAVGRDDVGAPFDTPMGVLSNCTPRSISPLASVRASPSWRKRR